MSQYPWLLLAVYVATVGVVQLVALWAATSRQPWLLRALAVWGAIVLLLPIRAYEPALLLTMSAALTMAVAGVANQFQPVATEPATSRLDLRYQLAHLFVAILFIATLLAIATQYVAKQRLPATFLWCGLLATAIAAITILAHRVAIGARQLATLCLLMAVIWTTAILMRLNQFPLYLDGGPSSLGNPLMTNELHSLGAHAAMVVLLAICVFTLIWAWKVRSSSGKSIRGRAISAIVILVSLGLLLPLNWIAWDFASRTTLLLRLSEVAIHMIPQFGFAALIAVASWLARAGWGAATGWKPFTARASALVLALIVVPPAAWIYCQLLWYPPYPKVDYGPDNNYYRIMEIGDRMKDYMNSTVRLPPNLRNELDEAVPLLRTPNYIPVEELEAETRGPGSRGGVARHEWLSLSQRLSAAVVEAADNRQPDRAADYAIAVVRYGAMFERGGTAGYVWVVGSIQQFGYDRLAMHRRDLSPAKAREVIHMLRQSLRERDDMDLLFRRDEAYAERIERWDARLSRVLRRLSSDEVTPSSTRGAIQDSRNHSEMFNRLLQADLAIRIYQSDHDRLPATLQELVPDVLLELSIDPYSGKPLIYRPAEKDFGLYSVGPDGVDNGGKFLTPPVRGDETAFDIRLN